MRYSECVVTRGSGFETPKTSGVHRNLIGSFFTLHKNSTGEGYSLSIKLKGIGRYASMPLTLETKTATWTLTEGLDLKLAADGAGRVTAISLSGMWATGVPPLEVIDVYYRKGIIDRVTFSTENVRFLHRLIFIPR